MRQNILKFVELCSQSLPMAEPIYEFGSLQVPGQEGEADLRRFFPGKKYVGTDMRAGPGVDKIIDLHRIRLRSRSVGTALMLDTIEHVEFVRSAIKNVHRVLKKDGILVISSHMNFPIHSYPNDYWRFTPEGLKSLLKPFATIFVDSTGMSDFPHTVLGFGCKGKLDDNIMESYMASYNKLKHWWQCVEAKLKERRGEA